MATAHALAAGMADDAFPWQMAVQVPRRMDKPLGLSRLAGIR